MCSDAIFLSNFTGQFWNIPITFTPYEGEINSEYESMRNTIHIVTVDPPEGDSRRFPADLDNQVWDLRRFPCLYCGNSQGGPWGLLEDPDDSVIQGSYSDYRVGGLFEPEFKYTKFEEERCST